MNDEDKRIRMLALISVLFFAGPVVADEIVSQIPAWQSSLEALLAQIQSPYFGAISIVLIELCMRAFKTQNPKSLLYLVANAFKIISKILDAIAAYLDQYLQKLK